MRFPHLLTLALIACGDTTAVAPIDPSPPPSPPPVSVEVSCSMLDRQSCLDYTLCTLVHVSGMQYECRVSRGECELGVLEAEQSYCEKRPNCRWVPGTCYCPCKGYGRTNVEDRFAQPCKCECGGGKPPACVAVNQGR